MPDATCPFCDASWTPDMLDALDRATVPSSCACCGGDPAIHDEGMAERDLPQEDIACGQCGRVLFRAPGTAKVGRRHAG
ncbi:hypothetical protein [Novosphingobium aquimarinum]|uniref:hypothetical protein n=1 Tax=Novosphingobium aquimarinum TaxID=2682494 RepID=UPI0012EBFA3F|nr:hypothetical protein [Novosphingobium aquimarinum]